MFQPRRWTARRVEYVAGKPEDVRKESIRIGCAGWSLRAGQSPLFGDGDSQLARYATRFDAVEINSSFHRPHQQKTYARWAASVPADFLFAVKMPRTITHDARLLGAGNAMTRFCDEVAGLGAKLGVVLVQLPPGLAFDARIAHAFFAALRRRTAAPIACEPRHATWFAPGVDALWKRHRIARVAADPPRIADASHVGGAGPLRYWRWHGSPRMYYSAYDDAALAALAAQMRTQASAGDLAWCIFDNTALGHAVTDAIRLQALCAGDADGTR